MRASSPRIPVERPQAVLRPGRAPCVASNPILPPTFRRHLADDGIRVSAEKQHWEVKTFLTGLGSRVELAIKERLRIQRLLPERE